MADSIGMIVCSSEDVECVSFPLFLLMSVFENFREMFLEIFFRESVMSSVMEVLLLRRSDSEGVAGFVFMSSVGLAHIGFMDPERIHFDFNKIYC